MQSRENKMVKTGLLFGLFNLASYSILGWVTTGVLDLCILYYFHELGKSRRLGANVASKGLSLFSSYAPKTMNIQTNEVENTFGNVINGGAAIADELAQMAGKVLNKNSVN